MYIKDHGISTEFMDELFSLAKQFFDQPQEEKKKIHMLNNGFSWRGYFQLGFELTSGKADQKEGYYFGTKNINSKKHFNYVFKNNNICNKYNNYNNNRG